MQERYYPAANCRSKKTWNQPLMTNRHSSPLWNKNLSRQIRDKLKEDVSAWKAKLPGFCAGLAIVQVGGREDSNVYIRMKIKAANEIGIDVNHLKLPRTTTQQELMSKVCSTNSSTFLIRFFGCYEKYCFRRLAKEVEWWSKCSWNHCANAVGLDK